MKAQHISIDSTVSRRDSVISREVDNEEVLLDLTAGIYFGLDQVGTAIWQEIKTNTPIQKILNQLVTDFEVTEAQASSDLLKFATQLAAHGLITVDQ